MTRSHASERLRHPVWHVAIAALALLTAAGWARDVSALTPTPTSTWTRTPTRTPTTTRTSTRTRTPTRTSTVTSVGCADGTREGFIGVNAFPGIAACAGTWSGHVSNGARLCASGWDVCSDRSPQVKAISFEQATAFAGCFAFNAANDNDQCNPCTGGDGADDMAGVGAACPSALGGQKSCLGSGRIDAACCLDYQSGTACQFKPGVTSGVVCCRGHCGDGMVDPGEPCDDGNASNADACRNDCRPNVCGDGFVNPASEQCDDGNTVNGDGCDSNCTATGCGNGIVTRLEQCDDGNSIDGDGCDSNCTPTGCGNGVVTAGEECDDGNGNPFDGCTACKLCGNGIMTPPEECDDGNTNPNDGCTTACTICGNGTVTLPEQCDDGNTLAGDGCPSSCAVPGCGNAIREGDEDCDDGGICIGGGDEGTYCSGPEQCFSGECRPVGGDGCAANCTREQAVPVRIIPGVRADQELQPGTSGAVLHSQVVLSIPLPFNDAQMTLRVGRARDTAENDDIPISVRADDLWVGPISIYSVGCLCILGLEDPALGERVAGAGSVTCTGSRTGVDLSTSIDHDTNDVDAQCRAGTVERAGRCEYAVCVSGTYAGQTCRGDSDCGGQHDGVCNGPERLTPAGSGPAGSARLNLRLRTRHFDNCNVETNSKLCVDAANAGARCQSDGDCPGGHCVPAKGPDGVPCTADDPVPGGPAATGGMFGPFVFLPLDFRTSLTTGVARAEILDPDDFVGGEPLTTQVAGKLLSCAGLAQGAVSGTLAGTMTWLDGSPFGDTATTLVLAASLCGNGRVDPGEDCDTGGESVSCDDDCTTVMCGDLNVNQAAGEQCDDGNADDHDACRNDCKPNVCGDGVIRTGAELCDDGNTTDGDGCDSNCTPTACGNGIRTAGEDCDDGNTVSEDGCSSGCRVERCGDGVRQAALGEQCDDGNAVNGDGCDTNCTISACGNGIVAPNEECDDGNSADGDCCSSACRLNSAGVPCFDGDVCDGTGLCNAHGACVVETGGPLDCDDSEPKTLDFCDPVEGCQHIRPGLCVGDCNLNGAVTIDEIITMVNMALGAEPVDFCDAGDANANGVITVDEIVGAVNNALFGCSFKPTPTLRPVPTLTSTPTPTTMPTPPATQNGRRRKLNASYEPPFACHAARLLFRHSGISLNGVNRNPPSSA